MLRKTDVDRKMVDRLLSISVFESPTATRFHNSTGRLGESPSVIQYMDCNSLAEKVVSLRQRQ